MCTPSTTVLPVSYRWIRKKYSKMLRNPAIGMAMPKKSVMITNATQYAG